MNLYPYTEFDLVEGFAEKCGNDFAYVAARKQWFCRSADNGQPCWEPDERSQILYWIRLVLTDINQNLSLATGTLKPNPNLCTTAAVRAVEELARADPHFAITETDLAPGALAEADAQSAKLIAFLRRDSEAKRAVEAPIPATLASPVPPPQTAPQLSPLKPARAAPRPKPRPSKPKPSNPAPTVDNRQTATPPRGLMDDMARWAAIGSAA